MKNSSEFGWDPQSQKLTCSEETWQNIIQVHPNTPHLKDKKFENFEEYRMVVGNHGAAGKGACRLSANGIDDSRQENVSGKDNFGDDTFGDSRAFGDPHENIAPQSNTEGLRSTPIESIPTMTNVGRQRRRTSIGATGSSVSNQSVFNEIAKEFGDVNKNLDRLVTGLEMMQSKNSRWVKAVKSTPGFTSNERWSILNSNINQDLKDDFLEMDENERRDFMLWRLQN